MKRVGIRELKANLSKCLSEVKAGQSITITDRKHDVALLLPLTGKKGEEKLMQLVQKGVADWSGGTPRGMLRRVAAKGRKVSEAVIEDRR